MKWWELKRETYGNKYKRGRKFREEVTGKEEPLCLSPYSSLFDSLVISALSLGFIFSLPCWWHYPLKLVLSSLSPISSVLPNFSPPISFV